MRKCLKCGSSIEDNSRYCPYCGCNLTENINEFPQIICKEKSTELAFLLAVVLPGISYFYLGLFKRGLLFFSSFIIIFIVLAIKSGFYNNIEQVNAEVMAILIIIVSLVIYLYQIFDVVDKTKLINNYYIRFLK